VTVEVETKFDPLMIRVCAAAPAVAEAGETLMMAGAGLPTVEFTDFEPHPTQTQSMRTQQIHRLF
jgi:hypothetical protein